MISGDAVTEFRKRENASAETGSESIRNVESVGLEVESDGPSSSHSKNGWQTAARSRYWLLIALGGFLLLVLIFLVGTHRSPVLQILVFGTLVTILMPTFLRLVRSAR